MNSDAILALRNRAKFLDDVAIRCGKDGDSIADLILAMLAENSVLTEENARLNKAIETLQASHKIEVENFENHYFNGLHPKRLPDGESQARTASDQTDNGSATA